MQTVIPRFLQTPACHDGCEEKEQPSRQAPMRNAALRRARFVVPLPPSPAAPTQTTPAELSCPVLNPPALSRLQCGTCTAPTLGAGWCRVTPTSRGSVVSSGARLLRVFDRLPTGSFGNIQRPSHRPAGPSAERCGPISLHGCALNRASHWFGATSTPPRGGFFFTRAPEKTEVVSVLSHGPRS